MIDEFSIPAIAKNLGLVSSEIVFRIPQIFLSFLGPTRRRCDSIVRSLRSLNYSIFQKRNIRLNAIIHKLETAAYLIICQRFVPDLWLFCNKDLRYENSFVYT